MGLYQNNPEEQGKGRRSRGSVRNEDRLADFGKVNTGNEASWGECSEQKLQAVIVGITALGGAVTFSLSRDLGAHSLTLLLSPSKKTLWFNGDAELDDELDAVFATLDAMLMAKGK